MSPRRFIFTGITSLVRLDGSLRVVADEDHRFFTATASQVVAVLHFQECRCGSRFRARRAPTARRRRCGRGRRRKRRLRAVRGRVRGGGAGRTSHGILPVENSIGGSIHRNYDLLLEHDLPIVAETELTVVHNLLALPGTSSTAIRRVFSHPQALAQCERFLQTLPGVEIVATYDTAGSARLIRDGRLRDTAAIASARAAEIFGLDVAAGRDPGLRRQHHPVHRWSARDAASRSARRTRPRSRSRCTTRLERCSRR